MRGVSRASYGELRDRIGSALPTAAIAEQAGDELFAVVRLFDAEHGLRRALADPTRQPREKAAVAGRLLHGRVSEVTEELTAAAAAARWATPGDMADAIEQLAIEALTVSAQLGGTLDDLEDDLFRFSRLVSGQPGLREALIGPAGPEAKRSLLENLLSGRVSTPSMKLITQVLTHPRGRSPQAALELCAGIAAYRQEQLIAVVRVAAELTPQQRGRLATSLAATYGKGIHINVVHDPAVLGGMSVQIGDELIDGTAASRLAAVRRRLAG